MPATLLVHTMVLLGVLLWVRICRDVVPDTDPAVVTVGSDIMCTSVRVLLRGRSMWVPDTDRALVTVGSNIMCTSVRVLLRVLPMWVPDTDPALVTVGNNIMCTSVRVLLRVLLMWVPNTDPALVTVGSNIMGTSVWRLAGREWGRGILSRRGGGRPLLEWVYPLRDWGLGTRVYVEPSIVVAIVLLRPSFGERSTVRIDWTRGAESWGRMRHFFEEQRWGKQRTRNGVKYVFTAQRFRKWLTRIHAQPL